jgi:hypothetical protein
MQEQPLLPSERLAQPVKGMDVQVVGRGVSRLLRFNIAKLSCYQQRGSEGQSHVRATVARN